MDGAPNGDSTSVMTKDHVAGMFAEMGWIRAERMGLCCAKDLRGALRLSPRCCAPVTPGLTVSSARGARVVLVNIFARPIQLPAAPPSSEVVRILHTLCPFSVVCISLQFG